MRINHNMSALNAHRLLNMNSQKTSKVLEQLSSGKRINRAADDATGMAISEKMDAQIRGLRMASRNALDGVSLIQTAEGALTEIHNILQRMNELSVQAANGTLNDSDRKTIQDEINQLTSEINRIGNTTEFNKQQLLKGDSIDHDSQLAPDKGNLEGGTDLTPAKKELDFSNLIGGTAEDTNKNIEALIGKGMTINGGEIEFYDSLKGKYMGEKIGVDIREALDEKDNDQKVGKLINTIVKEAGSKINGVVLKEGTPAPDAADKGSIQTPPDLTNQAVASEITITVDGKQLKVIDKYGRNGQVTVTSSADDTLSASESSGNLTIALAKNTAGNNTLANIQNALPAGWDIVDDPAGSWTGIAGSTVTVDVTASLTGGTPGLLEASQESSKAEAAVPATTSVTVNDSTLTVTDINGSNRKVIVKSNTTDALALEKGTSGELIIKLANNTPSKNSISAINSALGTAPFDTDFPGVTATDGGAWNNNITGDTIEKSTGIFEGGSPAKASTISLVVGYGVLNISDSAGGTHTATIQKATTGDLEVDVTGGNLIIKLGDTASENTVAAIQSLVQSKGIVNGTDFTKWTFKDGGNWDGHITADTLTKVSRTTTGGNAAIASTASVAVDGETLTIKDALGGSHNVTIEYNTTDDLAVDGTGGNLTIKLASTTANKNTAALIETAVKGVGVVDGTDFSKWTFTGSANWDTTVENTKTITTGTAITLGGTPSNEASTSIVVDGETLTIKDALGGSHTVTIEKNTTDALAVDGTGGNLTIKLANATVSKNTAALIETAVKGLGVVDGTDFSKWTFTGSANWDSKVKGDSLTQVSGSVTGGHPITPSTASVIVDGQTLKITDPTGANGHKLIVAQGTNDVLSVNGIGGDLKIYLANTTASNNNISEIENKLFSPVDGSDFSKWTFETGTVWDGNVKGSDITAAITKDMTGGETAKTEKLAIYNYQINKSFTEGEGITIGDITFKAVKVTPPDVVDPSKGEFDIGTDVSTQLDSLVNAINNSALKDKYTATRTGINGNVLTIKEKGTASGVTLSNPTTIDISRSTSLIIEAKEPGEEGNNILIEDGFYEDYKVSLQIGANAHQEFALSIGDIRAEELGLSGKPGEEGFCKVLNVTNGSNNTLIEAALDVTTKEGANVAIERYQKAVEKISELRARLGAYQNRLEHTISNIDNASENLTAALSRIQDVDMALAMSEYTKLNILQQSGTAMLAQANQRPQSILQLLQ